MSLWSAAKLGVVVAFKGEFRVPCFCFHSCSDAWGSLSGLSWVPMALGPSMVGLDVMCIIRSECLGSCVGFVSQWVAVLWRSPDGLETAPYWFRWLRSAPNRSAGRGTGLLLAMMQYKVSFHLRIWVLFVIFVGCHT